MPTRVALAFRTLLVLAAVLAVAELLHKRDFEAATSVAAMQTPPPLSKPAQESTQPKSQAPPAPSNAPVAPPVTTQQAGPLNVVVLDPGHGGADAGAHGANGVNESDIVLAYARAIRGELERGGLRVVMTREGNENPSFDERSAKVNALRGAVFITLHVSSSGPAQTMRAYSLEAAPGANVPHAGLINWDEAQQPHVAQSRRLAELVQIQLGQKFRGSPEIPAYAAVRQLRTVAAPAIAIEVSNVATGNANELALMGPGLAQAMARAVADFRQVYEAGAR